ncbi:hypothetical protein [Nocardia sp. NPDC052112]|uniref:hypothetical protein n=1 Tax=Nocardia sp. NPDC052112 TaxID=3155646 RepID=UPI00341C1777
MTQPTTVLENFESSNTTSAATEHSGSDTRAGKVVGAVVRRGRRAGDSSIKLKTVIAWAIVIAMVLAIGVIGWQLHSKASDLDALHANAADSAHVEQVALDYATAAAEMNFQDLAAWRTRLTKGTSPELSNRLTQAATSMEQIITPLQWVSTAKPIAAKVRSEANGTYSVDCFVSVLTKNSQAPEGIQSTATYQLSIDSRNNWTVTDIGGIGSALAGAGAPR